MYKGFAVFLFTRFFARLVQRSPPKSIKTGFSDRSADKYFCRFYLRKQTAAFRILFAEPGIKLVTQSVFYDEAGKRVRTKKEITDESGKTREGCTVIKRVKFTNVTYPCLAR